MYGNGERRERRWWPWVRRVEEEMVVKCGNGGEKREVRNEKEDGMKVNGNGVDLGAIYSSI